MQIIGYETAPVGDRPCARLARGDGGLVEWIELSPGTELSYGLGERHCAGTVADDGAHRRCPEPAAPYCETHTSRWPCARCTGECALPLSSCREEHAVYLAAFAPETFKVGVTRSWRLRTRLREQGADRAAHVRTVRNGRLARQIEGQIAAEHGITDRVRLSTKRRGFGRSVDDDAWTELLAEFDPIETHEFDYGLEIDRPPVAETVAAGSVRGTKGRLLVIERAGSTYATDLRGLVGHELLAEDGRALQASFDAF
ncbi:DUF2797 domain-containing protein [Halobacteriales archaeon QH_10_67_13]|nr:MAG: DUF2797 domain-containing protein [Halobacteriales archaeon QH_10_67_13]